jgi:hypothetical protein
MEPRTLRTLAAVVAGASFVALLQLSSVSNLSYCHIVALRCFAFSLPSLAAFSLRTYDVDTGVWWINVIWMIFGSLGFLVALVGILLLFRAGDTSAGSIYAATCAFFIFAVVVMCFKKDKHTKR